MSLRGQERLLVTIGAAVLAAVLLAVSLEAQQPKPLPGSEPCMGCHATGPRTGKRQPGMPPPFNEASLRASPHATLECTKLPR